SKSLGSVDHVINAAIAVYLVSSSDSKVSKSESLSKGETLLFSIQDNQYQKTLSVDNVIAVQKLLKKWRSGRLQEWNEKARAWYPRATAFQ
ncbi:hypothetical protein BGZ49_003004, partial [Haplosporangium sp. Z 27]